MFDMKRSLRRGMLLVALALSLGGLFGGQAAAKPVAQEHGSLEHLRMLSGQEFEIDFMSMMIEHHQGAVSMAELAADRANHQELKEMAQHIISDQTREINDMTSWLQQWYNATPKTGLMYDEMAMEAMMQMRNMTGDDFDREFLMQMHMHHREAIDMAALVPDRATHAELKTLGQNIATTQEAEVLQLMDWAMAWYNLDLMADVSGTQPVGMPRTGEADPVFPLAALLLAAAFAIGGGSLMRRRA